MFCQTSGELTIWPGNEGRSVRVCCAPACDRVPHTQRWVAMPCSICRADGHNCRNCPVRYAICDAVGHNFHTGPLHVTRSKLARTEAGSSQDVAPDVATKEDVVDKWICSVCLEQKMMPPLWGVCKDNRHVLCNICYQKLKNGIYKQPPECPQCRQPFVAEPMRNRMRPARHALVTDPSAPLTHPPHQHPRASTPAPAPPHPRTSTPRSSPSIIPLLTSPSRIPHAAPPSASSLLPYPSSTPHTIHFALTHSICTYCRSLGRSTCREAWRVRVPAWMRCHPLVLGMAGTFPCMPERTDSVPMLAHSRQTQQ